MAGLYFTISKILLGVIILCFTSLFFWCGIIPITKNIIFINASIKGYGTIKKFVEIYDGESVSYAPIFEYSDSHNMVHSQQSSLSTNPPVHHVGERIVVYYKKDPPYEAIIGEFFDLVGFYIAYVIFGIIGSIVGGTVLVKLYQDKRESG